ncbi:hypothetical protein C8Q77DRAFT_472675 [Trametes polyzona]|nr:hypothetical protein C8Q77DRAFT_472675 [Trametes polyzona]
MAWSTNSGRLAGDFAVVFVLCSIRHTTSKPIHVASLTTGTVSASSGPSPASRGFAFPREYAAANAGASRLGCVCRVVHVFTRGVRVDDSSRHLVCNISPYMRSSSAFRCHLRMPPTAQLLTLQDRTGCSWLSCNQHLISHRLHGFPRRILRASLPSTGQPQNLATSPIPVRSVIDHLCNLPPSTSIRNCSCRSAARARIAAMWYEHSTRVYILDTSSGASSAATTEPPLLSTF